MKLVILLLCLGLERYLGIGKHLKRYQVFDGYLSLFSRFIPQIAALPSKVSLLFVLLPALLIPGVIYYMTLHAVFGLMGLFLGVFLLLICLGPDDFYHQLKEYFAADKDKEKQAQLYQEITGSTLTDDSNVDRRKLTISILSSSNERFFGVIFWFIILGPIGAIFYRLLVFLRVKLNLDSSLEFSFKKELDLLCNILNWFPARFSALCYLIVGNFQSGIKLYISQLFKGLSSSDTLLEEVSFAALNVGSDKAADSAENHKALDMLDHALVVVLVFIAIFTLGAWIY